MFEKFVREEEAQAAIEYILLAGGILVAVVAIFSIYTRMNRSAGQSLNQTTDRVQGETADLINESIRSMNASS